MFSGSIQKAKTNHGKGLRQLLSSLALSALTLTIFAGKAHAQIVGNLDADIPFQFHVGNTVLPAGSYRIKVLDDSNLNVMEISSMDGSSSAFFQVQESYAKTTPDRSELIFNKYGDQYFLSKLFDQGEPDGSELTESRAEKQISKGALVTEGNVSTRRMQQGK